MRSNRTLELNELIEKVNFGCVSNVYVTFCVPFCNAYECGRCRMMCLCVYDVNLWKLVKDIDAKV
jgi:hypothetical protein